MVLTICVCHVFFVSGQYLQSQSIDSVTEYEYYDDFADASTTQGVTTILPIFTSTKSTTTSTTTTTTTTPKPTLTRYLPTRRNLFRTSIAPNTINQRKKFGPTKVYVADSYSEASIENAFVQTKQQQQKQPTPPHLRNALVDADRSASDKDYAQEKFVASDESNGNGNSFSRRYARFLFKSRSG